jgi:hypothetical protein
MPLDISSEELMEIVNPSTDNPSSQPAEPSSLPVIYQPPLPQCHCASSALLVGVTMIGASITTAGLLVLLATLYRRNYIRRRDMVEPASLMTIVPPNYNLYSSPASMGCPSPAVCYNAASGGVAMK